MKTLILVARRFEVNQSAVEKRQEHIDELFDGVIEAAMGCWVDVVDVASYTGACRVSSVFELNVSCRAYRDAPAPPFSKMMSNGSHWYSLDQAASFGYLLCSFWTHSSDEGFLTGSPSPDLGTHSLVVRVSKCRVLVFLNANG